MGNVKLKSKITGIQNHLTKQSRKHKNLTLEVESERRMETNHDELDFQRAIAHGDWDSLSSSTVEGMLGGGVG